METYLVVFKFFAVITGFLGGLLISLLFAKGFD